MKRLRLTFFAFGFDVSFALPFAEEAADDGIAFGQVIARLAFVARDRVVIRLGEHNSRV